jgi:predicted transcriptional regulator
VESVSVNWDVPIELHTRLKRLAVDLRRPMKFLAFEAFEQLLEREKRKI